jgi:osmoprotectant transport system permease protein
VHAFVDAFRFIGQDGQSFAGAPTLITLALKTLWVSGLGVGIALVLAIPLGVWLGHLHRFSFLAINIGNVGRALPSLAVLAIGLAFIGLGLWDVELALVILAVPPMLTNAYLAVDQVDREVVDAARGMGMTTLQIIRGVELPLAIPLIFAGIRTSTLFVISTTTIASLAGFSGTLGDVIANESSYRFAGVLGGAICVAALALVVEGLLALLQRAVTPRGVRVAEVREGSLAPSIAPVAATTA